MTVLRIDASIQGDRSASSALADVAEAQLEPGTPVVRRHLGQDILSAEAWPLAVAGSFTPEDQRTDAQKDAVALATTLATELAEADAAILALPLYNWGVSQHAKTWIDLAIVGSSAGARLLEGKPVVLLATRGGSYAPGSGKEGWDHSVNYLRRVIADVWGADLTVVERELTLVGVNPLMDGLAEQGARARQDAEEAAAAAGARIRETLADGGAQAA